MLDQIPVSGNQKIGGFVLPSGSHHDCRCTTTHNGSAKPSPESPLLFQQRLRSQAQDRRGAEKVTAVSGHSGPGHETADEVGGMTVGEPGGHLDQPVVRIDGVEFAVFDEDGDHTFAIRAQQRFVAFVTI